MRATEFRILGPLEAVAEAEPLRLGGPKQRALLALLLLRRNEVVPRERLVDAIWGESPPESALNSLQVYVHGLRRVLGAERIERRGAGYSVHVEPGELDLQRFEALVERAQSAFTEGRLADAADGLREALGLWRGVPLADLALEPVAAEAPALDERRVKAVELRNDVELALGRHDELVPQLAALVAEHPYRERLREQQILALYRSGRQKDALDAYRAARRVFVDELGVEPGPALQRLEQAVLRQEASLAAPAPRERLATPLPAPPTQLVGRRMEVAAVAALLREEARLVTLTGPGGTGKTRIAIAVAAELSSELRDGAAFVDLAPLSDADLLMPTIAHVLGVSEGRALAEELHDRSFLVVLDNLEQLLDGVTPIGALLAGAPGLRILATSRAPLRLYGEHEYPVPPLSPPADAESFESLAANDAVRLFAARARAADPGFELGENEIRSVAAICRRVDGLPLAIELAAARSKLLPLDEIVRRLEVSLDVVSGGARDVPPRQRALRAALDWSVDALAPAEQDVFCRLGVFAGGFAAEAAVAVAGGDVDALAERSLVRRSGERFAILETIRVYALERLREAGLEDETRERHFDEFLRFAEAENRRIFAGREAEAAYHALDVEHDNLRAAIDWAAATDRTEQEVRLAVALRQFWVVRGHIAEGRSRFERVVERREGVSPGLRAAVLTHGATFAYRQGDLSTARAWWEEALRLHREAGDEDEVARCLGELGSVAFGEGDAERAQSMYEESAELFEHSGNSMRLAIVLANLGAVATMRGDLDAAVMHGSRAAELQRDGDDRDGLSVTLHNLARNLISLGRLDDGRAALHESMELARSLDYREVLAYGLETSGELAHAGGDGERAARLLGASIAAFESLGVPLAAEEQEGYTRTIELLRGELGADTVEELHAAGHAAAFEEAVNDALATVRA